MTNLDKGTIGNSNCSFKVEVEYFKSNEEKNEYIKSMLNLCGFCVSRGIKTRFYFPDDNTMLEGRVIKNGAFQLDIFHTLKVIEK